MQYGGGLKQKSKSNKTSLVGSRLQTVRIATHLFLVQLYTHLKILQWYSVKYVSWPICWVINRFEFKSNNTVDGWNLAPPGMYETQ